MSQALMESLLPNVIQNEEEPVQGQMDPNEKQKRAYRKIEDARRIQLLTMIKYDKLPLKVASKALGINYSSAKTIIKTYRSQGRIHKKLTRDRIKRSTKGASSTFHEEAIEMKKVRRVFQIVKTEHNEGFESPEQGLQPTSTSAAASPDTRGYELNVAHPIEETPLVFNLAEYSEKIMSSYKRRCDEKLKHLARLAKMTLPALGPDAKLPEEPQSSAHLNSLQSSYVLVLIIIASVDFLFLACLVSKPATLMSSFMRFLLIYSILSSSRSLSASSYTLQCCLCTTTQVFRKSLAAMKQHKSWDVAGRSSACQDWDTLLSAPQAVLEETMDAASVLVRTQEGLQYRGSV